MSALAVGNTMWRERTGNCLGVVVGAEVTHNCLRHTTSTVAGHSLQWIIWALKRKVSTLRAGGARLMRYTKSLRMKENRER